MGVFLKHRDQSKFLKSYDGVTGELEFTDDIQEAKSYQNEWFGKAELDHLLFHFPEEMKEMIVYYT